MALLPSNAKRQVHLGFWRVSVLRWKIYISAIDVSTDRSDQHQPSCLCHDGARSCAVVPQVSEGFCSNGSFWQFWYVLSAKAWCLLSRKLCFPRAGESVISFGVPPIRGYCWTSVLVEGKDFSFVEYCVFEDGPLENFWPGLVFRAVSPGVVHDQLLGITASLFHHFSSTLRLPCEGCEEV